MLKKFCLLTVPAVLAVLLGVELCVRWTWNPKRGTPALYVADPLLVQRFAPHYKGWFAGVPVQINNLGLHAARDYAIEKRPNTFRILLLGDSVAFGHGSIYEHTYAYLLEKSLKSWRGDVDWQVWNAGVPGYNSAQELAYLQRVGPVFQPDLVIVSFHPNDIQANDIVREPTRRSVMITAVRNWVKQTFYSYEFYRRLYLQTTWRFMESTASKRLLDNLAAEDELLANTGEIQNLPQQQITPIAPIPKELRRKAVCEGADTAAEDIRRYVTEGGAQSWRAAIRSLQELHQQGRYRIMFFVNTAPWVCEADDLFYDGGSRAWNDFFVSELARGVPTLSTYDAFVPYRPSQMPDASSHALGNANRLKADLLFAFLKDTMLPSAPQR